MSTREEIAVWTNLTEARVRVCLRLTRSPHLQAPRSRRGPQVAGSSGVRAPRRVQFLPGDPYLPGALPATPYQAIPRRDQGSPSPWVSLIRSCAPLSPARPCGLRLLFSGPLALCAPPC